MTAEPDRAPDGAAISIETFGFRNLADDEVPLGPGLTVLHGENGAGKTNLLEAIFFALTGSSFRPGNDRDAIAHGVQTARAELVLAGRPPARLLASIDRSGERRHLRDGAAGDLGPGRRPAAGVFHPDRLALVKGPPAGRRAHFDRFLGALWPARAELRGRFGRTLAQRNALVSRIRAGFASPATLETWDQRLAAEAEPLVVARREAVAELAPRFAELATELGLVEPELRYRPRFDGGAAELAAELAALRAGDLGRAYTGLGPQLDEVEIRVGGRALRRFGSQGQQRAALLALLLGERAALAEASRAMPLLLLDDVMSELDPGRRRLLVSTLGPGGQAVVTATESDHVPDAPGATRIAVSAGRCRSLAVAA